MPEDHLITDDETRRIVEGFLTSSPWLGTPMWRRVIIGSGAEYQADYRGNFDPEADLGPEQSWSWEVAFTDPAGREMKLGHEDVLKGLRGLLYGAPEDLEPVDAIDLLPLKQWFTEPAEERRKLTLACSIESMICQKALYGRLVFDTGRAKALFGKKLDFFSDQRDGASEPE